MSLRAVIAVALPRRLVRCGDLKLRQTLIPGPGTAAQPVSRACDGQRTRVACAHTQVVQFPASRGRRLLAACEHCGRLAGSEAYVKVPQWDCQTFATRL